MVGVTKSSMEKDRKSKENDQCHFSDFGKLMNEGVWYNTFIREGYGGIYTEENSVQNQYKMILKSIYNSV